MGRFIDLVGKRFGKVVVLSKGESRRTASGQPIITWICQCDCGNIKTIVGKYLRIGNTRSCGCLAGIIDPEAYKTRSAHKAGKNCIDLKGQKFGFLTVLEKVGKKSSYALWRCECVCGNKVDKTSNNLRTGHVKSCGCKTRELCTGGKTHGLSDHPLYTRWCDIKSRCNRPNDLGYKNYGGRGITICNEWSADFKSFHDYCHSIEVDLDRKLKEKYEIDRIDVNGNYEPGNIRFVTKTENLRNTTKNIYLTIGSDRISLAKFVDDIFNLIETESSYESFYNSFSDLVRRNH
jgi:hypothetical protein